jgi:histidinol dehydrogenase
LVGFITMAIRIIQSTDRDAVDRLLRPRREDNRLAARQVARIVEDVRAGGDRAVRKYAKKFDQLAGEFEIPRDEWLRAAREAPREVRAALRTAAGHIATVARAQLPRGRRIRVAAGVSVEQRVRPLDRVGCYVPGGRYPLPSSLLMTAVPARVAGVAEIIAVCPRPEPVVMAAAAVAGVTRLFRLGGAHAIAALAFGTDSIPRVDRIVGPGNKYVALAKNYVSTEVGIDMQAGPSEILVVSDRGRPRWLAADLIAQAEHDPDARALLITWKRGLADRVAREVAKQLPSDGPARESLARHGAVIVAGSRLEAIDLANGMAPEHLVVDDEATAGAIRHAGAIFIGEHTAQVAGDYAIGSNHVLPTGGAARIRGGLHASDFVRVVSVQRVTRTGLERLAPTVRTLALAEGLTAHAQSIAVRQA